MDLFIILERCSKNAMRCESQIQSSICSMMSFIFNFVKHMIWKDTQLYVNHDSSWFNKIMIYIIFSSAFANSLTMNVCSCIKRKS